MFTAAYYALALAIGTTKDAVANERLREAFFHIHEAMRINQAIFDMGDVGELRFEYFQANNQIFLDIYGYVVYRQRNPQLADSAWRFARSLWRSRPLAPGA